MAARPIQTPVNALPVRWMNAGTAASRMQTPVSVLLVRSTLAGTGRHQQKAAAFARFALGLSVGMALNLRLTPVNAQCAKRWTVGTG